MRGRQIKKRKINIYVTVAQGIGKTNSEFTNKRREEKRKINRWKKMEVLATFTTRPN